MSVYATITTADFFINILNQNKSGKHVVIFASAHQVEKINKQICKLYSITPIISYSKSEEVTIQSLSLSEKHIFTNPNLQEIFDAIIVHKYCQTCYASTKADGSTLDRCSTCKKVNYCSRECQIKDWKLKHKAMCKKAE